MLSKSSNFATLHPVRVAIFLCRSSYPCPEGTFCPIRVILSPGCKSRPATSPSANIRLTCGGWRFFCHRKLPVNRRQVKPSRFAATHRSATNLHSVPNVLGLMSGRPRPHVLVLNGLPRPVKGPQFPVESRKVGEALGWQSTPYFSIASL
jgi:hypothetical protein